MKEFFFKFALKIWYMLALLPRSMHYRLASTLGSISCALGRKRSRVIKKNLSWCFATLPVHAQDALYRSNIRFLGQSFFDTGIAWFWTDEMIQKHVDYEIRGLDAFYKQQQETDQGFLMLGKHSQHLELDARLLGLHITGYGVARGSESKALNDAMYHGRKKATVEMSAKTNPRQFVRWLREGKTVAYFPDQDYGKKRSMMTTLLDVPATFTTAPYTLYKLSGCLIYFYNTFYENNKLVIELEQLHLPCENSEVFTQALALYIEDKIKQHPAEYLWAHRRFKSTKGKASYT